MAALLLRKCEEGYVNWMSEISLLTLAGIIEYHRIGS